MLGVKLIKNVLQFDAELQIGNFIIQTNIKLMPGAGCSFF